MIQNEYKTDEWRILTAVVLEGHIEYKKNELEKELRAHKNALQVGMNIKIEVHIGGTRYRESTFQVNYFDIFYEKSLVIR